MLNDIRVHIHQDEQLQEAIEQRSAVHISNQFVDNRNTFTRNVPNLAQELDTINNQNISIFCNQHEEYNLVDFGVGRTFYGEQPAQEVLQQLALKEQYSAFIDFTQNTSGAIHLLEDGVKQSLNEDVLVILGIGLGGHIASLLESTNAKHIIIYEPEGQYFKCSNMVMDWKSVFDLAARKNISLYFQLHKDARDLITDLAELKQHFPVNKVLIFQHYYHPMFDCVMKHMRNEPFNEVQAKCRPFQLGKLDNEFCPAWMDAVAHSSIKDVSKQNEKFVKNLAALEKYYPNIHAEFKDYEPQLWRPMQNTQGDINLLNVNNGGYWHGDMPIQDGQDNFENFAKHPNRDGLILGYNGEKLKHYLHYRLVKKTERLLQAAEDEVGILPDTIKSLILFGLGSGYQLQSLFENKTVEKLFICEPNRDFFYASLYAIDWHTILTTIDEQDGRLYINIGDDGTHLFRDLLGQFYNIGPYVLSQTYFYQGYYNAPLNAAIGQLREQLQIVISMGEYFDHACYGISHTKEMLRQGVPYMRAASKHKLSLFEKELPVIFIGNGPSLDYSLESIKEIADQAILVSCGTSLQVLHRNGIVPDFHAEIEQNRATHDWAVRINDTDYLKRITLISCNGIHPDTCALYKDVKIAFKEGESSTVSTLKIIGEEKAEALAFAFPTVTNFALNFFLKLGFNQLYLMGVDLGFVDATQHHSTQSGYYDAKGKELYNYAQENNTGLLIPGNFRSVVNTKHEFKIAKMIMEQSLAEHRVDCYNTSDGARIEGTQALNIDNILLVSSPQQKADCLLSLEDSFEKVASDDFVTQYEQQYNKEKLLTELQQLMTFVEKPLANKDSIFTLVEAQKQFLFRSYSEGESLFFYYLYGSMNYINAVLSKAAMHQNDEVAISIAEQAAQLWGATLADIYSLLENEVELYDCSASFIVDREKLFVSKHEQASLFVSIQNDELRETALQHISSEKRAGYCLDSEQGQLLFVNGTSDLVKPTDASVSTNASVSTDVSVPTATNDQSRLALIFINEESEWEQAKETLNKLSSLYADSTQKSAQNSRQNTANTDESAVRIMLCVTTKFNHKIFAEMLVETKLLDQTKLCLSAMLLPCLSQHDSVEEFEKGEIPYGPLHFHIDCALRHFWDMPKYRIFIEKHYFSELGAKNASKDCLAEHSSDEAQAKKVNAILDISDTKAGEFIEAQVISGFDEDLFVNFKTYLALPRVQHAASEKQQTHEQELDDKQKFDSATVLDQIGSRGLVVKRQFEASEVFRVWAKMRAVQKCIDAYMKADKHV
ncbi:6-hydroxymethylpterin diphosphokinase MptE-like protein [Glaciecola sp. MF2-115]|uniref:6-hydroxymethylpterin diphosphokinase MptE-like protein n=1 Tax=Glaciecola sp. MF2-115 TaxID=3384827 RepID=UPI0039A3385B